MAKIVVVDSYSLSSQLLGYIRQFLRRYPEYRSRVKDEVSVRDLTETTHRIIWNTIQKDKRYGRPEFWDDIESIKDWFDRYNPEAVDFDVRGEEINADEMSSEFYREVIDLFEVRVRAHLCSVGLDLTWEYLEYERSSGSSFLLRSFGDYRIYDYHQRNGTKQ